MYCFCKFLHLDSKHLLERTSKNVTVLLLMNLRSYTVKFSNGFLQIVRAATDFYIIVYFLIRKYVQCEGVRMTSKYVTLSSAQRVKWIKPKCFLVSVKTGDFY